MNQKYTFFSTPKNPHKHYHKDMTTTTTKTHIDIVMIIWLFKFKNELNLCQSSMKTTQIDPGKTGLYKLSNSVIYAVIVSFYWRKNDVFSGCSSVVAVSEGFYSEGKVSSVSDCFVLLSFSTTNEGSSRSAADINYILAVCFVVSALPGLPRTRPPHFSSFRAFPVVWAPPVGGLPQTLKPAVQNI